MILIKYLFKFDKKSLIRIFLGFKNLIIIKKEFQNELKKNKFKKININNDYQLKTKS